MATFDTPEPPRERRVHQDDCGADRRIQEVVDELGIMPADFRVRIGRGQAAPAAAIDFVENKAATGARGRTSKQPGAGGGFKDQVGRRKTSSATGDPGQRQRRRKGLQRDRPAGAPRGGGGPTTPRAAPAPPPLPPPPPGSGRGGGWRGSPSFQPAPAAPGWRVS